MQIYGENHIVSKDGKNMIYRDHREYDRGPINPDHEILRSWLTGKTGIETLKTWLSALPS